VETSGGAAKRVFVHVGPQVWREEVERYGQRSPARAAAERERRRLEDGGSPWPMFSVALTMEPTARGSPAC